MLSLDKNSDFIRDDNVSITNEYYDWDAYNTGKEVWGKQALDQMIENVLMTQPFERLFNLSYGTPLLIMLFENFNNASSLLSQIYDIIEQWVPITIDRNRTELEQDEDNHAIKFSINYESKNGLIRGTFARRFFE